MLKVAPAHCTCAPLTKFVPVTVMLNAPVASTLGFTLESAGMGFQSVTVLVPRALESSALTALIVTVEALPSAEGATYVPVALTVPVPTAPPATPFTSQVTL